jgi:hypothetical protein
MRIGGLDRYAPLKTALKGVGLKVDKVEKQDKRTVITVLRCGHAGENSDFPAPKAGLTAVSPEEQGTNGL